MIKNGESGRLTNEEFLFLFRTILDIRTIRLHVQPEDRLVKINNQDYKEFEIFVNVYISMMSKNMTTMEHRDMFSVGISSLKTKYVSKLIKSLEEKLIKGYELFSKEEKVDNVYSVIKYVQGADITDLDSFLNFGDLVDLIKKIKYSTNTKRVKDTIKNSL